MHRVSMRRPLGYGAALVTWELVAWELALWPRGGRIESQRRTIGAVERNLNHFIFRRDHEA